MSRAMNLDYPVPPEAVLTGPGNSIHLSLQGKGGVGKSLVASILAQYFLHTGRDLCCIDTDPVNQTLSQDKGKRTTNAGG